MESPGSRATTRSTFEPVPDVTRYRGFAITPRSFQINGSGLWTVDILIASRVRMRAFSRPDTYPTRALAAAACRAFGRGIIDGRVKNCSVRDL